MNIENYSVSDFLADESFYNWVKDAESSDGLQWELRLKEFPGKRKEAEKAKAILQSIRFKDKALNHEEITSLWIKIKDETLISGQQQKAEKEIQPVWSSWKFLKVAAVILPFLIATILLLFFRQEPVESNEISYELIEKYNPKGQKLTVFLSDGSKVKLNAESKITYQKPFESHQRLVILEGEAFFEVTPDVEKPFVVQSGELEIRVLGTSFNINAYPELSKISVAVKTGLVSVMNFTDKGTTDKESLKINPAEMVTYSKAQEEFKISDYNPEEVLSWSDGVLFFENATMEEFVRKIERWYGIDIVIKRKQPVVKGITGIFKDQTLEEILIGVHEASEFEYEFKDGKLIIK